MRLLKQVCRPLLVLFAVAFLGLPAVAQDKTPDATVEIDEAQFALIASVNAGGGKLHFQGKTYDFQIVGLGAGGIGISNIKATGNVYNLKDVKDFPGTFGQARAGAAVIDKSVGKMWLENTNGVVLNLDADREGLILSLGADGVLIEMK